MEFRCDQCRRLVELTPGESTTPELCPHCGCRLHDGTPTETYTPGPRRSLHHFQLIAQIGRGRFGEVWKAKDTKLDRFVAIKIPRAVDLDSESLSLFVREARAAAKLQHPNVVPVHAVGEEDGVTFIVSDLISGITLRNSLRDRRPSHRDAARMCAKIARGLQHAHESGVVHRDLKPENVMMDRNGEPHVMDFGLAKQESSESTIAVDGAIMGTASYMPPEQARGESSTADGRSDVYSLGIMLYEMLTGERPFEGDFSLVIHKVLNEEPPSPRSIDGSIPRDLETICLTAIQKAPDKRYSTAKAFADDLSRFLNGKPIHARRIGICERVVRWVGRNRMITLASTVTLLALTAVGFFLFERTKVRFQLLSLVTWAPVAWSQRIIPGTVEINSDPEGAEIYCIRISEETGLPDPKTFQKAPGTTPVRLVVKPGDYIVVAVRNNLFHEVYRRVPGEGYQRSPHTHTWFDRKENGLIVLPTIKYMKTAAYAEVNRMVPLAGAERFQMGNPQLPDAPQHARRVLPYYLDAKEVTVFEMQNAFQDFWDKVKSCPDADRRESAPISCVTWDQAAAYAELQGKRLPTEAEYEFAATHGGKQRFPWGDAPLKDATWKFGLSGEPQDDQNDDGPRAIFGLYSNVGEWTASRFMPYPGAKPESGKYAMTRRVVRGATPPVYQGKGNAITKKDSPRQRHGEPWIKRYSKLGFRCARSKRPRTKATDFAVTSSL